MNERDPENIVNWSDDEIRSHLKMLGKQWLDSTSDIIHREPPPQEDEEISPIQEAHRKGMRSTGFAFFRSKEERQQQYWPRTLHFCVDDGVLIIVMDDAFGADGLVWPHLRKKMDEGEENYRVRDVNKDSCINDYLPEIESYFHNVVVRKNCIVAKDPKKEMLAKEDMERFQKEDEKSKLDWAKQQEFLQNVEGQFGVRPFGIEFNHSRLGWRLVKAKCYPEDLMNQAAVVAFDLGPWDWTVWSLTNLIPMNPSSPWIPAQEIAEETISSIYKRALDLCAFLGLNTRMIGSANDFLYPSGSEEPRIPAHMNESEKQVYQDLIDDPPTWFLKEDADTELIIGLGCYLQDSMLEAQKQSRFSELGELMLDAHILDANGEEIDDEEKKLILDDSKSNNPEALHEYILNFGKIESAIRGKSWWECFKSIKEDISRRSTQEATATRTKQKAKDSQDVERIYGNIKEENQNKNLSKNDLARMTLREWNEYLNKQNRKTKSLDTVLRHLKMRV